MTETVTIEKQVYEATLRVSMERAAENERFKQALHNIILYGPACQHDDDCPLNSGEGYDQGCATCSVVLARKGLKDGNITK